MITSNIHTHTNYVDGKNSPREMIAAALEAGLTTLGFSEHAYASFDRDYTMTLPVQAEYVKEIRSLAEEYAGRIHILCGLETDLAEPGEKEGYDYLIGSSHYIPVEGEYIPCDVTVEQLRDIVRRAYGGDAYKMAEEYFATLGDFLLDFRPDVAGHMDLITKTNQGNLLFDEESPRYQKAALEVLEKGVAAGVVFEVNTGAMARGYMTRPYPAPFLLRRLREMGGRIVITSDTHSVRTVTYAFREAEEYVKAAGFTHVWQLGPRGWEETAL